MVRCLDLAQSTIWRTHNEQSGQSDQLFGRARAAFSFDRRQNGMRFSADLGRLCQQVNEQVRNAVARSTSRASATEVRRAMMDVGAEVRERGQPTCEQAAPAPRGVNVDVRYEPAAASPAAPSSQQEALMSRAYGCAANGGAGQDHPRPGGTTAGRPGEGSPNPPRTDCGGIDLSKRSSVPS